MDNSKVFVKIIFGGDTVREIRVHKLDETAFRKYGAFQNLTRDDEMDACTLVKGDFKPDLLWLNFGNTTLPTISVCLIHKQEKMIVNFIEYHKYTCECLVALDDDVIIYVGTPERGEIKMDNIEAFYVPRYTAVKLNPCVLHGGQFPVHNDDAHMICMLPGRTFMNDMNYKIFRGEDEQGIIIRVGGEFENEV